MNLTSKQIDLQHLPHSPGVYQFFDSNNSLLYIGKAKDLKKRVTSYFTKETYENAKTQLLVKKVSNIKFTIVDTEWDALLLENTLIKKHQPKYNVQLKDGKTYPFICIKSEQYPRIFSTRNIINDGSEYYGPYASVKLKNTLFELITKLFPLRNCNLNLSSENIAKKIFKVCLEYQIGNCKGPCENLQSEEEYNQNINHIRGILKGNVFQVIKHTKKLMQEAVRKYEFEKAHLLKEKLIVLERHQNKSVIVNPRISNVDVFSIESNNQYAFVNFLKVINGTITQTHTLELKKKLDEKTQDLLSLAITNIREKFNSSTKEVVVPFKLNITSPGLKFVVPNRGDKKKLLELSQKNAKYYMQDKLLQLQELNSEQSRTSLLIQMQKDLRLKELPVHIECFDNSNLQGKYPVSALVVFKNAKPSKDNYRIFNIRTVDGPDDYATMEEVLYRRYKRQIDENQLLPQLIVIDGGKGQLNTAHGVLDKLGIEKKISIISIAKKLEEIYYPGDTIPLYLDKRSSTLKIIQQLRNEAHRFGIKHHRKRRIDVLLTSELSEIEGVGKSTIATLLKHFKSVKRLGAASYNDVEKIIGKHKANLIIAWIKQKSDQNQEKKPFIPPII